MGGHGRVMDLPANNKLCSFISVLRFISPVVYTKSAYDFSLHHLSIIASIIPLRYSQSSSCVCMWVQSDGSFLYIFIYGKETNISIKHSLTNIFVIKYFRIAPVWIFASQLPDAKERSPVYIWDKFTQIKVLKLLDSNERWPNCSRKHVGNTYKNRTRLPFILNKFNPFHMWPMLKIQSYDIIRTSLNTLFRYAQVYSR